MDNREAITILRMVDGLTSMAITKSESSNSGVIEFMDKYHEAIDLACDALSMLSDTSLDIEGGKK